MFSWNTPTQNKKKVTSAPIGVGNTVKIIDAGNTGGLDKRGRTGTVTRIEGNQYEVNLHCTHTGGHAVKSTFDKTLNRHIGDTGEKFWFTRNQLSKC